MLDWSHLYPPTRRIISDNVQYCAETRIYPNPIKSNNKVTNLPASVTWYSGVWERRERKSGIPAPQTTKTNKVDITVESVNATRAFHLLPFHSTAQANFFYEYVPASLTATYVHNLWSNTTAMLPIQRNSSHVTIPRTVLMPPSALAEQYVFTPIMYTAETDAIRMRLKQPPQKEIFSTELCLHKNYDAALCNNLRAMYSTKRPSSNSRKSKKSTATAVHNMMIDDFYILRNFTCDLFHTSMSNRTVINGTSAVRIVSHHRPAGNILLPTSASSSQRLRAISDRQQRYKNSPVQQEHQEQPESEQEQSAVPNMMYHFIGASHMRYNFDAVSEYHYGTQVLDNVPRKHDALQITNMRYNFIANARHQSGFLTQLCSQLEQDRKSANFSVRSSNHTFIFQTGAWDLAAPLRRAMQDSGSAPQLLDVFRRIFTGTMPCGRLRHVLWLTSVPHPLCYNDKNVECDGSRSYRTNTAIAALNQFYLDGLFDIVNTLPSHKAGDGGSGGAGGGVASSAGSGVGAAARIILSVIDAFGIIKPRLMFSENNEINCLNHFTCRVSFLLPEQLYGETATSALLQTPGGAALVKSILLALSLSN